MEFRYARHTNRLEEIVDFYTKTLQLVVLGDFKDHDGYNGVFIGKADQDWHLEFTANNEKISHLFNDDDALVIYPTSLSDYESILSAIESNNQTLVDPKNPYWKENGVVLKDPDGMNIIISKQKLQD